MLCNIGKDYEYNAKTTNLAFGSFFCGNDILFLMCKLSKCHCRLCRGAVILCGPLMMLILSVCVNSGIVLDALFLNKG